MDSSLIVTALTQEATTDVAQAWLSAQTPDEPCASWWVDTEVASALAQKLRAGALDDEQRIAVLTQWRSIAGAWRMLPVERRHFAEAADLTAHNLRAADALHLAIARSSGAALATRDEALAVAARLLGVDVHRLP